MLIDIEWRFVGDSEWEYLCTMSESNVARGLEELRDNAEALYRRAIAAGFARTARSVEYRSR